MNEDDSHYFYTRAGQRLDADKVASWVDQYAGTQVKELILNPNAMRTSYGSKVWDPIWRGYDPNGPDDQPLLKSYPPEGRNALRGWIHTAWQLHQDGIDPYRVWIDRSRKKKISPWISMRMNDLHCVDDEQSFLHSEFWRNNPQLRRVSYRFREWRDKAFDYGRQEVRAYHMKLVKELIERYDFDGLELDWMRFGSYFRPGYESEGVPILTAFVSHVRRLLDNAEQKRGHRIKLGARIPSRPVTAVGLGMDGVTWARKGLVDMLVITPHFATIETDMPIELWRQLLDGTNVTLAAGLELHLRPYPPGIVQENSLETARGAAISFLNRGADRVYLFNYFDLVPGTADAKFYASTAHGPRNYPLLLRELGSIKIMAEKPRRHIVTFTDTWAPGEIPTWAKDESRAALLPASSLKNEWQEFRVPIGPKPNSGKVMAVLGLLKDPAVKNKTLEVRLNGEVCRFIGPIDLPKPAPDFPAYGFDVPLPAVKRGYNLIEVLSREKTTFGWVELRITP